MAAAGKHVWDASCGSHFLPERLAAVCGGGLRLTGVFKVSGPPVPYPGFQPGKHGQEGENLYQLDHGKGSCAVVIGDMIRITQIGGKPADLHN